MRVIYTLLFSLALPFILARLWIRGRKNPAYRQGWLQRLGYIQEVFPHDHSSHGLASPNVFSKVPVSSKTKATESHASKGLSAGVQDQFTVWLHAVSVGEVEASTALIRTLIAEKSITRVLLTNTTPTGAATARTRYADLIESGQLTQQFIPYDLPIFLKRFLRKSAADMVIIMETEVWPNLLAVCDKKQIPIVLANARLAKRSQSRYARLPRFSRQVFNQFSAIITQTPIDKQRFAELGVADSKLHIGGNLKCDHAGEVISAQAILALKARWGKSRPVWIAGSTHEGEENILIAAHQALLKIIPDALFVIVPRHPERFDSVFNLCEEAGLTCTRQTTVSGTLSEDVQIHVLDVMGELLPAYAAADICFVAGTLQPIGGHNILEPALFAKPIIVGPETFKIEFLMSVFREAEAILEIDDQDSLTQQLLYLFQHQETAKKLGQQGLEILNANRGSSDRHMVILRRYLPQAWDE